VHLENEKCTGCGKCTAVCPAETFVFPNYDLYRMLDECDTFEDTVFTCQRQKQAFPNEFHIPCVGTLSNEALLYIGLKGNGPVFFNLMSCPGCAQHQAAERFSASLAHVRKIITDAFGSNLITLTETSQLPGISNRDRRSFLIDIGGNVVSLVKSRYGTSLKKTAPPQSKGRRIPQKTALLEKAILAKDGSVATQLLAQCAPKISLTESCNLCPRCTGMCPTGAIKLEKQHDKTNPGKQEISRVGAGSKPALQHLGTDYFLTKKQENNLEGTKTLSFVATKCTGCGLCAAFCKMQAITVSTPPLLRL
jgi:ferredoxin